MFSCQNYLREFCFISDALRTVENSPHEVGASHLEVSLVEVEEDEFLDTAEDNSGDEANVILIVSGTLPSKEALRNYFKNERRSGGGEVLELVYTDEGNAVITFAGVKGEKTVIYFWLL